MKRFFAPLPFLSILVLAIVRLADTYLQSAMGETDTAREVIPKAKAAVLQALELDGNLADAHLTILSTYEFDWDGTQEKKIRPAAPPGDRLPWPQ
jgi:hypothetical protein